MNPLFLVLIALFPALVIVAALRDATTMTIPNWLCLAGLVGFVPIALIAHMPMSLLIASLTVGIIALVAGMAMFAVRWIGGGDAKLLAMCALWMGWPLLMTFLLWTALAGGALAIGLLTARKLAARFAPTPDTPPRLPWLHRLLQPDGDIPYGVAIAIGAMIAYPASPIFQLLHAALLH